MTLSSVRSRTLKGPVRMRPSGVFVASLRTKTYSALRRFGGRDVCFGTTRVGVALLALIFACKERKKSSSESCCSVGERMSGGKRMSSPYTRNAKRANNALDQNRADAIPQTPVDSVKMALGVETTSCIAMKRANALVPVNALIVRIFNDLWLTSIITSNSNNSQKTSKATDGPNRSIDIVRSKQTNFF